MFQKLTIVGNLTRDPEMRYLPTGMAVTTMNVAVNGYKKSANGNTKTTLWMKVTAWGKQAEACNQYLTKGSQILAEGKLTFDDYGNPRVWTNKQGEARASFEMSADDVKFLSRAAGHAAEDAPDAGDSGDDDDMPF